MTATRKFLAVAVLALVASATVAGVARADWIDAYGYVHGCRTFVNSWGYVYTRCF